MLRFFRWMMAWAWISGALVFGQSEERTSGGVLSEEQAAYNVHYYDLSISVNPALERISGTLAVHARLEAPLSWLVLDLDPLLSVSKVEEIRPQMESLPLPFERRKGQIWISLRTQRPLGARLVVAVSYAGKPRSAPLPPWQGGFTWSRTAANKPWIATSCQNEGADLWFPVKDHPSDKADSMAIRVNVPAGLTAVSNGILRRTEKRTDGSQTFHWVTRHSISPYAVALNIAPYQTVSAVFTGLNQDKTPVTFWHLPESAVKAPALVQETLRFLSFFESILGPYPFRSEKLGLAQTPFLGMEHQTILAYGANFRNTAMTDFDAGFDALLFHELAHEWFGNLITNRDWKDWWLHEGFATYLEALYAEKLHGLSAYRTYMNLQARRIQHDKPLVPERSTDSQAMTDDIYVKGAWVLHSLRYKLGLEKVETMMRRFLYPSAASELQANARVSRMVDTAEWLALANQVAGEPLDWFFEAYLKDAKPPQLQVIRGKRATTFIWKTFRNTPFYMPIDVYVEGKRRRIEMPTGKARIEIPDSLSFVIDPDRWVLRGPDLVSTRKEPEWAQKDFVGTYWIQPSHAFSVYEAEAKLFLRYPSGLSTRLVQTDETVFETELGEQVQFIPAENEPHLQSLRLQTAAGPLVGTHEMYWKTETLYAFQPPSAVLKSYKGRYRASSTLQNVLQQERVINVSTDGKRLLWQQTGSAPVEIFPLAEDVFEWRLAPALIFFNRNVKGAVESVTIEQGNQKVALNKKR